MSEGLGTVMTEEKRAAFKRLIQQHARTNTRTPEAARASLVREGTHTRDGRLTAEYGGKPQRTQAGRA